LDSHSASPSFLSTRTYPCNFSQDKFHTGLLKGKPLLNSQSPLSSAHTHCFVFLYPEVNLSGMPHATSQTTYHGGQHHNFPQIFPFRFGFVLTWGTTSFRTLYPASTPFFFSHRLSSVLSFTLSTGPRFRLPSPSFLCVPFSIRFFWRCSGARTPRALCKCQPLAVVFAFHFQVLTPVFGNTVLPLQPLAPHPP